MYLEIIQRFGIGMALAGLAALLQGCLLVSWVAAVGVGSTMSGSVEFEPFENTWVAPDDGRVALERMDGLAVTPFAGDEAMAGRMSAALRRMSTMRVVGPEQLADLSSMTDFHGRAWSPPAQELAPLAHAIASRSRVNCVLFGTVETGPVQTDRWGNKEVTSNRLKLLLVDAEGDPLWKDELPYRVIEGAQPFPEEWFQESLMIHLAAHARAIGLAEMTSQDEQREARSQSSPPPSELF